MWNRQTIAVVAFVLFLRLPFLNQAILGDDVYYLYGAQHAQIDPLHPLRAHYVFGGVDVSMQGHPHPPFNVWFLGALLAIFRDVREPVFHAAYILFSLIAALSALSIARRFTSKPLLATLLFCAAPPFVVNGNSLESDLPLVSFWLLTIALHLASRWLWCAVAMVFAAFAGYQSIVLLPILFLRREGPLWLLGVIPAVLGGWQLFERMTSGALPAQVLTGYFETYGLQKLENKLRNAIGLLGHVAWLATPLLWQRREWLFAIVPAAVAAYLDPHPLCWVSVGAGAMVLAQARREKWLGLWVLIFFGAALAIFFAGASRYLLPVALPLAIIAAERARAWHVAATLVPGLLLAVVNYQHWDAYRALKIPDDRRVWINAELGARFYLESQGGVPLERNQRVLPGEWIVSSQLTAIPHKPGNVLKTESITSQIPLRIIGIDSRSGFSTVQQGLRPFDISTAPIDTVTYEAIVAQKPTKSFLTMNDPEADRHIVAGVFELEDKSRWAEPNAIFQLKRPPSDAPLEVVLYLPPSAPGRVVTIKLDGAVVHSVTLPGPGLHTIKTKPLAPRNEDAQVEVAIDKAIAQQADARRLGMVLASVGFRG
ncbi:MAG: glycosyltransferase family 39 protein [Acidobacteria bacterium]|nr:glycosyltransferase family 39 protein [Acidobacteriota bacterium]